MNKKILLLMIAVVANISLFAQIKIIGVVLDIDTQKPLSCAKINIFSDEIDTTTNTDQNGSFEVSNLPSSEYCISVNRDNYRYFDTCFAEISDNKIIMTAQLYSYDSPNYRIKDIAKQDVFNLGFACYFYAPNIENNNFGNNISVQLYNLDFHFKLANRVQIGFNLIPLEFSWNQLKNTDSLYIKERYFGTSCQFSTYFRFIPTTLKKDGSRGLFFDIGATYNLPYYYAYSRFIDKYNKVTTRNIKNYNDFEAMFRVGYSWWSLNANYRFTNVLKETYIETPKLTLGVELLIPMSN